MEFIKSKTTYNTALGIYATFPVLMAPTLFKIDAPYGRFAGKLLIDRSYNGKWSWFIMEVVSPITFVVTILAIRKTKLEPIQVILCSCWMIHYINRSIIYPLRTHSMAPIHIFASSSGVFFNLINGYTNAFYIGNNKELTLPSSIVGLGVFIWCIGFVSNIYHDSILFKLRGKNKKGYSIPQGGLFNYISCPNYFSEVVEWSGFALAAYPSYPALLFVFASIANLFPRAWRTHRWYKRTFKDYPLSRKAVVPFLF